MLHEDWPAMLEMDPAQHQRWQETIDEYRLASAEMRQDFDAQSSDLRERAAGDIRSALPDSALDDVDLLVGPPIQDCSE